MTALRAILLSPDQINGLSTELTTLVRAHMARRSGLKGTAYRAGLAMLERARPGIVERAARKLLPRVIEALEPFHARHPAAGSEPFSARLQQEAEPVVAALMRLADQQAAGASDPVRQVYARFRGGAQEEVRALLPALGELLDRRLAR